MLDQQTIKYTLVGLSLLSNNFLFYRRHFLHMFQLQTFFFGFKSSSSGFDVLIRLLTLFVHLYLYQFNGCPLSGFHPAVSILPLHHCLRQ